MSHLKSNSRSLRFKLFVTEELLGDEDILISPPSDDFSKIGELLEREVFRYFNVTIMRDQASLKNGSKLEPSKLMLCVGRMGSIEKISNL